MNLLGTREIADLLGVKLETVHMWRTRGVLPPPYTVVSDRPAWREETILGWAEETGRLEPPRFPSPSNNGGPPPGGES